MTDDHRYTVDLNLHHPSCDPGEITKVLGLIPWFARKQGDPLTDIRQKYKSTAWLCHFQEGAGNAAFDQTLQEVVLFISKHKSYLLKLSEEDGTAELVLNGDVAFDDGKIFELSLDPFFLEQLSQVHFHLRIQAWSKVEANGAEMSSEECP